VTVVTVLVVKSPLLAAMMPLQLAKH